MSTFDELPGIRVREVTAPDGVRLSVAEGGAAGMPVLVFLHGFPDNRDLWTQVASRLSHRFRIVAYDTRGAGRSDRPEATKAYELARLGDDFAAVLDAVAPGEKVHVVGHDWGSLQGWEFVSVPGLRERIASFTPVTGMSLDHLGLALRQRLTRPGPLRTPAALGQAAKSWYVYAIHIPGLVERLWPGKPAQDFAAMVEQMGDTPSETVEQDGVHGLKLYRANIRQRLRSPRPDPQVDTPVQLVVPDADPYLSRALYDDVARWVPNLRRRDVSGGHWVPRGRADLLSRWIADFVDDIEAGRPVNPQVPGLTKQQKAYYQRFRGQLAVITGAGSGIGRATALALAEAGARLVLLDRDEESVQQACSAARRSGTDAEAVSYTVDVTDAAAMEAVADKVKAEHGVPDLVVNNAGVAVAGPFLETGLDDWKRVLDVNLWGVIHGCLLFGRMMAERGQGGHIVNIASAAGFQPSKMLPAYSTTKAAVLMLTECLREELADSRIGVTAICPGFVATNITNQAVMVGTDAAEQAQMRAEATAAYAKRNYPPEKVADAILRSVAQDIPVLPVTPEAKVMRAVQRVSPRLRRRLARMDPSPKQGTGKEIREKRGL